MSSSKAEECRMCEARTINLARSMTLEKPDMQIYDKCQPPCARPFPQADVPLSPACIKILSKEEELRDKCGKKIPKVKARTGHGPILWLVKGALVTGALYLTHQQGVWGDQLQTEQAVARWREYARSVSSRQPPKFDCNGNVIATYDESLPGFGNKLYSTYKAVITTCFSGSVQLPKILLCMYEKHQKQKELKRMEEVDKMKV